MEAPLEPACPDVLAAFAKIDAKTSRVMGCIFLRVSSRGTKFFFARFIALDETIVGMRKRKVVARAG